MNWQKPPWREGRNKHRLALRPVGLEDLWQNDPRLLANKHRQLVRNYTRTVSTLADYQTVAPSVPGVTPLDVYPDWIANVGTAVAEDLCLIDTSRENRFVAGCLAAPSYWSLGEKLGKPLYAVHERVHGMNQQIGKRIDEFFYHLPLQRPFRRENWFVHPERIYFRPEPEVQHGVRSDLLQAYFRSEEQTILRLDERFVLFAIGVRFTLVSELQAYPEARRQLAMALRAMDGDEIAYFGGVAKHARLSDYVASLGGDT